MNESNEETPILNPDVEAPTPNFLFNKHTLHTYKDSLEDHKGIRWAYFIFSFTYNAVFLGFIIVLLASDADCNAPIRKWFVYYGVCCASEIAADIMLELAISCRLMQKKICVIPFFTVFLLLVSAVRFVLFVIGNFIVFENNNCEEQFEDGYTLVAIIVLITYVAIGVLIGLVMCCCCYGMILARIINESIS